MLVQGWDKATWATDTLGKLSLAVPSLGWMCANTLADCMGGGRHTSLIVSHIESVHSLRVCACAGAAYLRVQTFKH